MQQFYSSLTIIVISFSSVCWIKKLIGLHMASGPLFANLNASNFKSIQSYKPKCSGDVEEEKLDEKNMRRCGK